MVYFPYSFHTLLQYLYLFERQPNIEYTNIIYLESEIFTLAGTIIYTL